MTGCRVPAHKTDARLKTCVGDGFISEKIMSFHDPRSVRYVFFGMVPYSIILSTRPFTTYKNSGGISNTVNLRQSFWARSIARWCARLDNREVMRSNRIGPIFLFLKELLSCPTRKVSGPPCNAGVPAGFLRKNNRDSGQALRVVAKIKPITFSRAEIRSSSDFM